MPLLQPILNLAELLYQKGIRDVVVSPGSRSAPLTLAVARHPHLRPYVVADERSAGFVALGLAQQRGRPVAVICTSGSAVYNLSPAVAEAYFSEVPLVLLTADRPREWVHQLDGQTIVQAGIFGAHVKRSAELPADYAHPDARWFIDRTANELINLSQTAPAGPVHLNVPLREPFYPTADEPFRYEPARVIEQVSATPQLPSPTWHRLLDEWEQHDRKLIVLGQAGADPLLADVLGQISRELGVPVVGEVISNLPSTTTFVTHTDTLLAAGNDALYRSLQPDLLITAGRSLLTRNLKTFLRQYPATHHWHIQPHTERLADPFRTLTTLIPAAPTPFFANLFADLDYQRFRQGGDEEEDDHAFLATWHRADAQAGRLVQAALRAEAPFTDWQATGQVLDALPAGSVLHLANSMPVRYANLSGLPSGRDVVVWANRGTSGIDGCVSTAVGAALATDTVVTLLVGDVAFFYDRNALWPAGNVPNNLRLVVFNNDGGHIFRMIDGPAQQPELERFFETPHGLTAERTAADAGLHYVVATDAPTLAGALADFFAPASRAKLLEIRTDKRVNAEAFRAYKEQVRRAWGG